MDLKTAEHVLINAVIDNDGTFVRLRLGVDPGEKRLASLKSALKLLAHELDASQVLARDIVYLCASIIHFSQEAILNIEINHPSRARELRLETQDLAQNAYNVLAGIKGAWRTNS